MSEPKHRDGSIVDVVDRAPKPNLHGVTWNTYRDAFLDEISRCYSERDMALDELLELAKLHPDIETDEHFANACLALL